MKSRNIFIFSADIIFFPSTLPELMNPLGNGCVQDKKSGMGEKPGFFPNGPTPRLQEKAGFLFLNHFFVLYTGEMVRICQSEPSAPHRSGAPEPRPVPWIYLYDDVANLGRRPNELRGRHSQMPVVRVGLGAKIVFWDGKATTIGHLCAPFA